MRYQRISRNRFSRPLDSRLVSQRPSGRAITSRPIATNDFKKIAIASDTWLM